MNNNRERAVSMPTHRLTAHGEKILVQMYFHTVVRRHKYIDTMSFQKLSRSHIFQIESNIVLTRKSFIYKQKTEKDVDDALDRRQYERILLPGGR